MSKPDRPFGPGPGRPFGQGEIRSFTGLRGCASVLVMAYHFALSMPPGAMPASRFLRNGYLWVDLFFLLSGFVMAYSQTPALAGGYRPRVHAAFLMNRLARIYPLYAVVIVESALLLAWRAPNGELPALAGTLALNLGLVQAWGLAPSLEGAAWSISTEWAAYLAFPLLWAACVAAPRRVAWLASALALLAIARLAAAPGPFTFPDQNRSGPLDIYSAATAAPLVRCVAEFTLGLAAFRVARFLAAQSSMAQSRAAQSRAAQSRMGGRPAFRLTWNGPAALAAAALLVAALSRPGLDVGVVVLFAVLLVSLSPGTGLLAQALGASVPYRLGQWSYSIYLIHDKFSRPAEWLRATLQDHVPFAPVVAAGLTGGVVVACGAATFHWIERPLRILSLKGVRSLPVRRGAAPPGHAAPGHAAPGHAASTGIVDAPANVATLENANA